MLYPTHEAAQVMVDRLPKVPKLGTWCCASGLAARPSDIGKSHRPQEIQHNGQGKFETAASICKHLLPIQAKGLLCDSIPRVPGVEKMLIRNLWPSDVVLHDTHSAAEHSAVKDMASKLIVPP